MAAAEQTPAAPEQIPAAKRSRGRFVSASSALRQTRPPALRPALPSRRRRAPWRHWSGAVCRFFLQGRCRFGDRCRNEHPSGGSGGPSAPYDQGASRGGGRSGGGGRWGTADQRHRNGTRGGSKDHGKGSSDASAFGSSVGGSRHVDFSQNRFSGLRSSNNNAAECKDQEKRLLESVVKDMEVWESSGKWLFSSYSPLKEKPNVPGFLDVSPEELRLEYYTRVANGDIQSYLDGVQWLAKEWRNRQLELKALNASTKAALVQAFL